MNCISKIDIDKLLMKISKHRALRRKSQSSDLFSSAFFPHFPTFGLNTDSPYLVLMRKNAGKMRTRITPNTDSFYAVFSRIFPHSD